MEPQQVVIERRGSTAIVTIVPKSCDGPGVVDGLRAEFGFLAAQPLAVMALDCVRVEFMNSKTLGLILRLKKVLRRRGVRLAICRVAPNIRESLRITRLDHILTVRESVEEAITGIPEQPAAEPAAPCATCAWPQEGKCKMCLASFCEDHGYGLRTVCRRHRWFVWGPCLVATGLVAVVICLWVAVTI